MKYRLPEILWGRLRSLQDISSAQPDLNTMARRGMKRERLSLGPVMGGFVAQVQFA